MTLISPLNTTIKTHNTHILPHMHFKRKIKMTIKKHDIVSRGVVDISTTYSCAPLLVIVYVWPRLNETSSQIGEEEIRVGTHQMWWLFGGKNREFLTQLCSKAFGGKAFHTSSKLTLHVLHTRTGSLNHRGIMAVLREHGWQKINPHFLMRDAMMNHGLTPSSHNGTIAQSCCGKFFFLCRFPKPGLTTRHLHT